MKTISVGELLTEAGVKKAVAFINACRDGTIARDPAKPLADQFRDECIEGNLIDPARSDPKFVAYSLLAAFDVDDYRALWDAAAVPELDRLAAQEGGK